MTESFRRELMNKVKRTFKHHGYIKIPYVFWFKIMHGYRKYCHMLEEYPESQYKRIYFMDYKGSGDTYLVCCQLLSQGMIDEESVFVSPKGLPVKIAKLFGFQKFFQMTNDDAQSIRAMERFCGMTLKYLPLLYESLALEYSGIMRRMQGHNGLNFMDLLRIGLELNCGIENEATPLVQPEFPYDPEEIDAIFKENNLVPGRTVLMAPYAGAPEWNIYFPFFEELAKSFKAAGYCVCTNTTGSNMEPPIVGTKPILVPYGLARAFCEEAGFFIGLRSGLCDIISGASNCKKVILYPAEKPTSFEHSWMDFFSLNKMKLCEDAIEFEINNYDTFTLKETLDYTL